jgi:hypothetical protein
VLHRTTRKETETTLAPIGVKGTRSQAGGQGRHTSLRTALRALDSDDGARGWGY